MKELSVIIPCYNREKYLERCFSSIIKQDCFEKLEVVIVDDCSSDNSREVIANYCEKYKNFKYVFLDKPSGSPSKPRNVGISVTNSKYIVFLDPDDRVAPNGYDILLSSIKENNSDIVIGVRVGLDENEVVIWEDFVLENNIINCIDKSFRDMMLNRPPSILKTIFKREIIIENEIYFDERITMSEDEIFDMKYLSYCNKMSKINDPVYLYTIDAEDSITTKMKFKIFEQLPVIFEELCIAYKLSYNDKQIENRICNLLDYYCKRIVTVERNEDIVKAINYVKETLEIISKYIRIESQFEMYNEFLVGDNFSIYCHYSKFRIKDAIAEDNKKNIMISKLTEKANKYDKLCELVNNSLKNNEI